MSPETKAILAILEAVDSGALPIATRTVVGAHVVYATANGWRLRVSDSKDWYLAGYQRPGGDWVELDNSEDLAALLWWSPQNLGRWSGLPSEGESPT